MLNGNRHIGRAINVSAPPDVNGVIACGRNHRPPAIGVAAGAATVQRTRAVLIGRAGNTPLAGEGSRAVLGSKAEVVEDDFGIGWRRRGAATVNLFLLTA